jgi:hypothetical protein
MAIGASTFNSDHPTYVRPYWYGHLWHLAPKPKKDFLDGNGMDEVGPQSNKGTLLYYNKIGVNLIN